MPINILKKTDERSREINKNIIISLCVKTANIISSLLILPLTINYINPTQYGIWLTLSTIIGWINFFDLGLGNGFRNKFAEAKAKGNTLLARQYLSTTYFMITLIATMLYTIILFVNSYVDWSSILKLDQSYQAELNKIFAIVCGFMCLNMIANIFTSLLSADQKPGYAAIIQGVGQYISLLVIYILTKISYGSLFNLALYFSGVPCLVMIISAFIMFNISKYKIYSPKIKHIKLALIKPLLSLGSQFFIIYMCLILIFQLTNIVISRELGSLSVTEYNIANRYFNIIYMVCNIIIAPYWSAFTDAYTKKDKIWMKKSLDKLERFWIISVIAGVIMLLFSPIFYRIWIGDNVSVSFTLSTVVLILILSQTLGNIYMFLINGIGSIRIQLIIYIIFAIIAWPSLIYSCRLWGICGIVIMPTVVYVLQSALSRIQLRKHISGKANGIWAK